MYEFDKINKEIEPKRIKYRAAKESSRIANEQWKEKKEELEAKLELMRKLQEEFEKTKAEKLRLENEENTCKIRLSRAKGLKEGLKDEQIRWKKSVNDLKSETNLVVGDVLLCSGVIAYLGVFPMDYRASCLESWEGMLKKFGIEKSHMSFQNILGDPIKIQGWNQYALPTDTISTENAIILDNSTRYPLIIDPQMQASEWIKNMKKARNIKIIKSTQEPDVWKRVLSNSLPLGIPVILEDIREEINPTLENLMKKSIEKKGGMQYIKIGDEPVSLASDFEFYMCTKLARPHFAPEVCVAVTMLNFTVTEKGLEEQMLNIIMEKEEPDIERNRVKSVSEISEKKSALKDLENKILDTLNSVTGNILDNEKLIEVLNKSKENSISISKQLEDQEKIRDKSDKTREQYRKISNKVSNLYFCISDLVSIEPMYQYSLKYFINIYRRSLDVENTTKDNSKAYKIKLIENDFTYSLYCNICKSLFEKDKLLFSLLLATTVMKCEGKLPQSEIRFLAAGSTSMQKVNNPAKGGWLSDKAWNNILEVSKPKSEENKEAIENFTGFAASFEKNLAAWEKAIGSSDFNDPTVCPWPDNWATILTSFQKLILVNILRQDLLVKSIQDFIKDVMKDIKFLEPPGFDLEASFSDSKETIPIIFVLSPGADPLIEVRKLAEKVKATKVKMLSLGQGQSEIAKRDITAAKSDGSWIVLQNCHLAVSFMPELEKEIEKLIDINAPPKNTFRLWLTSMPSEKFPVSILQNGIKLTNEPPKGIKNNLMRSYNSMEKKLFDQQFTRDLPSFKKLLFGLCFFNAMILERRKYGPLGWNISYEFSQSDLAISISQLHMFNNEYKEIPWEALNYMAAEANYGGRVTDPMDRRSIKIILSDYYTVEILKDSYRFCNNSKYYAPPEGDLNFYLEYIKALPLNDPTEVFGLHSNADITSAINDANAMLSIILTILPRIGSGSGQGQEQLLEKKAADILSMIPEEFNIDNVARKHPIKYKESMNTVLQQELLRFNNLTKNVKYSLIQLQKAIKGLVIMSSELDAVTNSLFDNTVPESWQKVAYPSLKPLGSWIADFVERLKFMQNWIDKGAPPSYWISGFFFTQSFLTGTLQNYARKKGIAIDTLTYDFAFFSEPRQVDINVPPEDGCYVYGLYLEGARWNHEKSKLDESKLKELYCYMPYIWLKPIKTADLAKNRHIYACPVYKTSRRAGVLSTTGHSTNFVLNADIPMQEKDKFRHWVKRGVALLTQLND